MNLKLKKLTLFVCFFLCSFIVCAEPELDPELIQSITKYEVKLTPTDETLRLDFRSVESLPADCSLKVTDLRIKAPSLKDGMPGMIKIKAEVDETISCLPNMNLTGRNYGSITFSRGWSLPSLEDGHYQIIINGDTVYSFKNITDRSGNETNNGFGRD